MVESQMNIPVQVLMMADTYIKHIEGRPVRCRNLVPYRGLLESDGNIWHEGNPGYYLDLSKIVKVDKIDESEFIRG